MKIYFVTGNESKFKEAALILKSAGIELIWKNIRLDEPNTRNQEEVVLKKAEKAYKEIKEPVIVDDTAIYFDAYPSFPGTFTRFLFEMVGFTGLEKLLKGLKRTAYFRTLVCYKDEKVCKIFSGIWKGRIVEDISKKVNPDWPYNSIFVPDGYPVPLSEISNEERAKNSHRKKALLKLVDYLNGRLKE